MSLPSRERGLKSVKDKEGVTTIESLPSRERGLKCVCDRNRTDQLPSLPSRERGLKSAWSIADMCRNSVAPFAGAWIEISVKEVIPVPRSRRSLRGSVD